MECDPTARELVVNALWPALRLFVARAVAPSLKVTVPVGVPLPGELALTMAVNVTGVPKTDGFCDDATVVAVESLLTVWVSGEAVLSLPVKLLSPLYTAVTVWAATLRFEIAPLVAVPLDRVTGLPKAEPSIENCTVPVRVPAPGATGFTVAVNVTDWPETEGLADEATVVVVDA